ncbi:hypothetical protein UVI_02035640 [Ustilaginoidea virens]|uniref:Uncharacterized protein n=1 Tax=Ustilaginoidea virens TaxID=1159556 RepID=A0A1B5KSY4_USTVR|nr:hypothetical protein UVI_02035640 [Ustilaginoidea virens]
MAGQYAAMEHSGAADITKGACGWINHSLLTSPTRGGLAPRAVLGSAMMVGGMLLVTTQPLAEAKMRAALVLQRVQSPEPRAQSPEPRVQSPDAACHQVGG